MKSEPTTSNLWNFKITSANRFLPVNTSADGVQIVNNIFEPANEGMIINGDGCIIVRNILEDMVSGVIRCTGTNNTIAENKLNGNINSNFGAIYVYGLKNLVYGNTITEIGSGFGRLKVYGDGNKVVKNNLTSSAGIEILRGSDNIICGNRILRGGGLSVAYGNNNIFYANHIEDCGVGAIIGAAQSDIDYEHSGPAASNNTLYHNNFINNTEQVLTDWAGYGVNYFDNSKEGNFWSDYTGDDVDGDGVGDSPYIIDYKRKDSYPLMAPFDIGSVTVELPEWETPSFVLTQSEPFPFVPVAAASVGSVIVVVAALLVYFKKHKK